MTILRRALKENPQRIFACDTEVRNIDVMKESPRGHGTVTCFSVYCGDVNFGEASAETPRTHLWVDTMGKGVCSEAHTNVESACHVIRQ